MIVWILLILLNHHTLSQPVEISEISTFICQVDKNDTRECKFQEVLLTEPYMHFRIKTKGTTDENILRVSFDNHSHIHTFPENFCGRYRNVEVIFATSLSLNNLEDHALTGCRHLQVISLSNNNLSQINPTAFEGLTHLKELYLSNNKLEHLEPKLFKAIPNLEILSLSINFLKSFPESIMKELGNIRVLKLHSNQLTNLNATAMIENMPKLKELFIADNQFPCKHLEIMLSIFKENHIYPSGGLIDVNRGKPDTKLQMIEWIHCYP